MTEENKDVAADKTEVSVDWSNPPLLADLKADYTEALSHHNSHVTDVDVWLDNMHIRGAAKPKARTGRSSIVPKLIRKQAEWRYSSLSEAFLSHEDLFNTEPVTFEDKKAAYQNGLVLNNQFNTILDKVNFIDNYVRAAVDEGSVLVRLGWEYEDEDIEVPNLIPTEVTDPFKQQLIEQGAALVMQNPEGAAEQLPPELLETVQLSIEMEAMVELLPDPNEPTRTEKKVLVNKPTVEVCDYKSSIVDPTCKGIIKNANFIIWKFETSLGQLERDGDRYHNLENINLENNAISVSESSTGEESVNFNFKDDPRKKFDAYEYWGYYDIDGTGIPQPFVATWVGDTMIRLEKSPFPDKQLPFVLVQYLPVRKAVYGEPDGALLEDNQQIAGAVMRGMIDIMGRSAAGQIGYRKDALDITNLRKFEAGKDYSFNPGVNPGDAFHTHIFPEIPTSAPFLLEQQNNDAESMTGIKAFANGGISGEGLGKSATAARSAIDAAGKRELGILRRLAGGIIEIGRKIIAMNAVFLSEEEIVRITNEEFVTIDREDLAGRIDIKLKISTAEADDAKAQELSFMLQTVGNSMPPEFSYMIMVEIARLRKMPELAKRIEEFKPEPDPIQQKMAELSVAREEAEIEKIRSETAENYAEAKLNEAQTGKAQSQKDIEDLKFVETSEGVTQERDLQKGRVQAEGNIALEREKQVTKEAVKDSKDGANSTNSG